MTRRARMTLCFLLVVLLLPAVPVEAAEVTHPDRESTYPEGVENITQAPWTPRPGEDVTVTLTLGPDARVPAQVALLFCRVEPNYVCTAVPPQMESADGGRVWTATIAWDDRFMTPETRHVGYNITMRTADPSTESGVRRVYAPIGNHWLPETYPEATDGHYYFYAYEGASVAQDSPAPGVLIVFVAVLATLGSRCRGRGAGHV